MKTTSVASEALKIFQEQSLNLLKGLVQMRSAVFVMVDSDMLRHDPVLIGVDMPNYESYKLRYHVFDPMSVHKMQNRQEKIIFLRDYLAPKTLESTEYYKKYLSKDDTHHIADMFFRQQGRIIATICIHRDSFMPAFTDADNEILVPVQEFLEYALNNIYQPFRISQREFLICSYHFTDRETDVIELLLKGADNKAICDELNIKLSTVKTHIENIFKKTGASSRTQLIAQIYKHLKAKEKTIKSITQVDM